MTDRPWHMAATVLLDLSWGLFALVWIAGAVYTARQVRVERRARGPWGLALATFLIAWLLFHYVPAADWRSLTVTSPAIRAFGAALLLGATAFTLWARIVLGVMWSSTATLKQDHVLRTGGPYAITRHPIYTGILGMLLGTALLEGTGAWGVIFLLALLMVVGRIRVEEHLLTGAFGTEYARYRAAVPQLVPGLRIRRSD